VNWIWENLHHFAAPLCHQLPERTMSAGGLMAPLCFRCSAFYGAFLLALAVTVSSRDVRSATPRVGIIVAVTTMGAMACDALLWASSNILRHMTGTIAGIGLAMAAGPVLARVLEVGSEPKATTRHRWVAWLGPAVVGGSVALLYPWSLADSRAPLLASTLTSLCGLLALAFTVNALLVGTWLTTDHRRVCLVSCGMLLAEVAGMLALRD
jgi:uncharacterized membrane protein